VEVRGKTLLIALVAALSLLSATAVAGGHRVVKGSKGDDELTLGSAANRVFARGGDDQVTGGGGNDRLLGGQDSDLLDGGDGNDVLNGGGDGRDKDRIVCGDGYDVVVLGRNDVILVEVSASGDADEIESGDQPADEADESSSDDADEPDHEEPEAGDDDGCEKVKGPGSAKNVCASHGRGCENGERACPPTNRECEDPMTDEPEADEPEADEPVEDSAPDEE
jgi:hypothetical protein